MFRKLFYIILTAGIATTLVAALFGGWAYYYLTRDLPRLSRIEDYTPPAVSRVLARDGTLLAEFYSERRYPVKLQEVPDMVRKAFLAAEDASFYSHHGIDPVSIARAVVKNMQSGNAKQGASTITQQRRYFRIVLSDDSLRMRSLRSTLIGSSSVIAHTA